MCKLAYTCAFSPCSGRGKILFLDVDGVLHSYFARCEKQCFRPDCMKRLKRIVEATECHVVLSSSWRKHPERLAYVNEQLRRWGVPTHEECMLSVLEMI